MMRCPAQISMPRRHHDMDMVTTTLPLPPADPATTVAGTPCLTVFHFRSVNTAHPYYFDPFSSYNSVTVLTHFSFRALQRGNTSEDDHVTKLSSVTIHVAVL